jgi:hypothetical protein
MKNLRVIVPVLLLAAVTASGCWLTSGQFVVSTELPDPLTVLGSTNLVSAQIDLNDQSTYRDHKSDLKDLSDCAVLGVFTNNPGSPAITVEVWLTPALTNYTTEALLNADATRVRVWGPFSLAVGQSKKIGWDESAALFSKTGKAALIKEVLGDGIFTLYAKGTGPAYNFTITDGSAVVVIDAGK